MYRGGLTLSVGLLSYCKCKVQVKDIGGITPIKE